MGHRRRWLAAATLGVVAALGATATSAASLPGPMPARADGSIDDTRDHIVVYEPDDAAGGRRAARPERVVARLDPAEVARLEADPTVAHVEPDHRYELAASTAIPAGAARDGDASGAAVQLEPPWGLDRIDQRPPTPLSGTFAPRTSGDGVTVYVVDDGVDPGHPDFGGRVGSGWTGVHDGGGDTECGGHGNHVAGTVAGAEYGVAKQARIIPVRVINCSGWTSLSTLLDALDWILEDHRPGDPAVVNLSIGGPSSAALADALAVLDERGIVMVAAAGNGATDACTSSPADAPTAIAVGATDVSDARAQFSNWGTCVDLFAPGVAIRSVGPSGGDQVRSGTSMAAPHVAGAVALLLADAPTSTPDEVRERLSSGATTGAVTDRGPGSPDRLLHVRPASDGSTSDEPGSGSEDVASLAPPGTRFVAGVPERVMDTRPAGRMLAGSVVEVGVGSSSVMSRAGSVSGVVLNVTVVDPVAAGFVSVFPCGAGVPEASNANVEAGSTVATAVVSGVGPSGDVCVFSSVDAHVLVDLAGVLTAGFVGRSPERVADTRSGPVVTAGTVVPIDVRAPAEATAVVATVTAVDPDAAGHLTVFACGPDGRDPVPASSNLNFAARRTVANAVVSAVGPDGHLCVIASADTHVLVDVSGWSTSGVSGHRPERVLDTRSQGRVAGGSVVEAGVAASPAVASGASAVVLNLTVVDPVAAGFVTVFPCGGAVPDASNANFEAGATVANAVVSAVGEAGEVCVFTSADSHVLVDAVGAVA